MYDYLMNLANTFCPFVDENNILYVSTQKMQQFQSDISVMLKSVLCKKLTSASASNVSSVATAQ